MGQKWTDEEVAVLQSMIASRKTREQMSGVLGRSVSAIDCFMHSRRLRPAKSEVVRWNHNGGKPRNFLRGSRKLYARHVAEGYVVGRLLSSKEIVHHIDIDSSNDTPGNLYVCKDGKEHQRIHAQLEQLAGKLVKAGVITFTNGVYHCKGVDHG